MKNKNNKAIVAPSLLAADFLNLGKEIAMLNESDADWIHLDIMDGVFVPNISYGFPIMKFVKPNTQKPLDVHLMIIEPDRYIQAFKDAGADILTVHYEACNHLHRTIQQIKASGMKAGVSLNPHTPVSVLEDIIEDVNMVLLMSVNPGFGGQKFIENTYKKIQQLKQLIMDKNLLVLIEVDGGVDTGNSSKLVKCGADVLVAGSSVFGAANPEEVIWKLKNG